MPVIPAPPSGITGPIGQYLQVLFRAVDGIPTISKFSAATPNSLVTGYPGDLAVNQGSASTDRRIWVLGGATRTPSSTGWVLV